MADAIVEHPAVVVAANAEDVVLFDETDAAFEIARPVTQVARAEQRVSTGRLQSRYGRCQSFMLGMNISDQAQADGWRGVGC